MFELDAVQTPEVAHEFNLLRSRINVGRLIMNARIGRNMTQEALARLAGTKQSRISEIETLEHNCRFETLDKIALALGMEITLQPRIAVMRLLTVSSDGEADRHFAVTADGPRKIDTVGNLAAASLSFETAYGQEAAGNG